MSVGRVEPHRHRVRIAVERQVVAARSDVADFGDDAAADFVLNAGMVLRRVRLLRVVVDELGSLLHREAGALCQQLLDGRSERRHRPDIDAGEVRIDPERGAAVVRRRERLVEHSGAGLDRRLLIAERFPRDAEPRRELELRRVLEHIGARRDALRARFEIVEAQKAGDASLGVVRHGEEFVAQPVAQREIVGRPPLVLREQRDVALTHVPARVGVRHVAGEAVDRAAEEVLEAGEAELAAEARIREAVEMIPLEVAAELRRVGARAERQRVGVLEDRLRVVDGRRRRRPGSADAGRDRDRAEVRIGREVHVLRDRDRRDEIVGAVRAIDGRARDVQHARAEEVLILIGEVARIGRRRLDELRVILMRRRVRAIARRADEHRVGVADFPVDLADEEVLARRIDVGVAQLRGAVAEVAAVRDREEQIEVRLDERVDRDRAGRQHAVVRRRVGQPREVREREILPQSLVAPEVEQRVLDDRAAGRAAELVARERRIHLRAGRGVDRIEEVRLVELAVAEELEHGAVEAVRARLRDGADHAAGGAAELGGVVVRLDAELLHRVDAEQHARHARRRLVGHVGDVGALEQVAGHLGTRAADRHLRAAEASGEIARRGAADGDARLQRRELHEVPAVERQLGDLRGRHDAAGDGAAQVDVGGRALDGHVLVDRADFQREIGAHLAADLEREVLALRGGEP